MNSDYFFKDYRLSEFYDDMYSYDDDFMLWSQYIRSGMRILEVACGTGRLTKLILEKYDNVIVDALDYSKEMLEILENKKINSPKKNNILNLINADMRNFISEYKYDIIVISANSLNHIEKNEDLEKTIYNMYVMLKKGGFLLFDILNPAFEFLMRDHNKSYDGRVYKKSNSDSYFWCEETSKYDYSKQINRVNYLYYYCDSNGNKLSNTHKYKMEINVRLFFPQEMDYYIMKSPFHIFEKFDWYDKRPFLGNTMEQIYVLQRS